MINEYALRSSDVYVLCILKRYKCMQSISKISIKTLYSCLQQYNEKMKQASVKVIIKRIRILINGFQFPCCVCMYMYKCETYAYKYMET